MKNWLHHYRLRLAHAESLLHYSALGIIAGFFCAIAVILFRFLIDWASGLITADGSPDNFEDLPVWMHFCLPFLGAVILGIILSRLRSSQCSVGVAHVMTGLHARHGDLPVTNALVQFFGGIFALATGQSGGREGPAIHIGAAVNSQLGQLFRLPNNSLRVLVGCGTATAITVSFNTPLAGVIFAMEVVMMEYTVAGFTPIVLATVTGTAITQAIYGNTPVFSIPPIQLTTLWELPFIMLTGALTGCAAAAFIKLQKRCLRYNHLPILYRLSFAGFLTGLLAIAVPDILGIGYDTLNDTLLNQLSITLLLSLVAAKLIATAVSCGLGMPVGLIGPSFVIGGAIGGVLGGLGHDLFPDLSSSQSFYVLLGMGSMMGAILNAPLAALLALLELTNNPGIIFPGMLAIITATLTNSELFRHKSAHRTVLDALNQSLRTDPLSLALQRTSVASMMDHNLITVPIESNIAEIAEQINENTHWIVVMDKDKPCALINPDDLNAHLAISVYKGGHSSILDQGFPTYELRVIDISATLRDAWDLLRHSQAKALYVTDTNSSRTIHRGILTHDVIRRHFNELA